MASNSRPLLLDLRDEDFKRGYTGNRPPSLISPEPSAPVAPVTPAAPAKSGKAKTVALFLAAIAASVITSKLLNNNSAGERTTVGVEAAQKVEAPRTEAPPTPVATPVVAEVARPIVAPAAAAAPVIPHAKPIQAAAPKHVVAPKPVAKAAPPPKTAEEKPAEAKEEPKPATPTYGVEEAGF